MKHFKYPILCFVFLLLSCETEDRGSYEDPFSPASGRDRRIDRRGNFDNDNSRTAEIRRLKGSKKVISSELESRFDGGYYDEEYSGPECKESQSCTDICDSRKIPRNSRNRCYRAPRGLVEKLTDGFLSLLNISKVESVDISPGLIAGMLDINEDLISDLVEDRMSKGDLKSFLAWMAVNEDIAQVFLEKDRRSEVIKKAFRELGRLLEDSTKSTETGLNAGLIQNEDSFFYLSASEGNEYAFQIAYEVLESVCSSRDCKLGLLCARENKTRIRSRIFGYDAGILNCRTAAEQGRRSRRKATCYIHGATAWSYLDELIDDDEIRDSDFKGEQNQITVDTCNDYCGRSSEYNKKCQRVL